ncbi:MAG: hypothetical protein FWD96_03090 [Defluviitaleaceae bacterium]|nr:hypothetical protein [Defluviitaleaceae bacterium]
MSIMQRYALFDLLQLKELNKDISVNMLDEKIDAMKLKMHEDDIAWAEKKIVKLYS